jgi:hypothetical protein
MENNATRMATAKPSPKTVAKTGRPRLGEPTLTASDWAEAALQLIAEKAARWRRGCG